MASCLPRVRCNSGDESRRDHEWSHRGHPPNNPNNEIHEKGSYYVALGDHLLRARVDRGRPRLRRARGSVGGYRQDPRVRLPRALHRLARFRTIRPSGRLTAGRRTQSWDAAGHLPHTETTAIADSEQAGHTAACSESAAFWGNAPTPLLRSPRWPWGYASPTGVIVKCCGWDLTQATPFSSFGADDPTIGAVVDSSTVANSSAILPGWWSGDSPRRFRLPHLLYPRLPVITPANPISRRGWQSDREERWRITIV